MEMIHLESLDADPVGISCTMERIKETRQVSRADVAPFIQHFPMSVSLNNFSEEPSSKGVDIALEGFATIFKVAAGVALVGVLGIAIYNFVRSRNSAATSVDSATMVAKMEKDVRALIDGTRSMPAWQNRSRDFIGSNDVPTPPDGTTLGLIGEVNYLQFSEVYFGNAERFERMLERRSVAGLVALGKLNSVTEHLMRPTADYLTDLSKRVQQLRKVISDMPGNVNAGKVDQIVDELNKVDLSVPRSTVIRQIDTAFDRFLPPPKAEATPASAILLEDRSAALKAVFEERDKEIYLDNASNKEFVDLWQNGDFEKLLGRIPDICRTISTISSAPSATVGRTLINECEELKKKIAQSDFPHEVDARMRELLEDIRLDSVASMAIMDMVMAELRQFASLARQVSMGIAYVAAATAAFSRKVEPAKAKRLAQDAATTLKTLEKIKI